MTKMTARRTILVVDDDEIIRRYLCSELERSFHNAIQASDGETALHVLSKQTIEILIVDIRLPDLNGIDLLKRAKELQPDIEVIVVTGYGAQDIAIQALRSGALDYLEKPIDRIQLEAALGRAVEQLSRKEDVTNRSVILVVDDDPVALDKLSSLLRKESYDVLTAEEGKQAITVATDNKVDIIICDIMLPDINGIEVLKAAKNLYDDIEIIVVTGKGDQNIAVEALREGAFDYLQKPLELDELLYSVERAIERIMLQRNLLYRQRELKINSEIISKMKDHLELELDSRTDKLKQTQTQLFQAAKLATLGEMAAGVAHEINQPLTGIALATTTLRKLHSRGKLTDDEFVSATTDIESCISRIGSVIDHIRMFARQDSLRLELVNINDAVTSSLALLGEQLRLHEIEIIKNLEPDLPKVTAESHQLEQVIINIISNSRDALDDQVPADTDVGAQPQQTKKIEISTQLVQRGEQEFVSARFTDNGTGIPDDKKDRVMEPFFTTKEVGKGTGLGLSISYGIIQNHKGLLEMESKEGEFTTFEILLPIKSRE